MIIGFTGKAGSGKSTACGILLETKEFQRINFKDALVRELKEKFGPLLKEIYNGTGATWIDDERMFDWLFSEKPPLVRKLMQCYGTEVRRGDDPLYWIKRWKEAVTYTKADVLTDDVRFLNEAEAIKDFGGIVIRIDRTDIIDTGTHSSEVEMDQIVPDFTITVDKGDLEGLREQLMEVVHSQALSSTDNK